MNTDWQSDLEAWLAPLEAALWRHADYLVGGKRSWLIIDDTSLSKKGEHSVGVTPQYASTLGRKANCQTLVRDTGGGICRLPFVDQPKLTVDRNMRLVAKERDGQIRGGGTSRSPAEC